MAATVETRQESLRKCIRHDAAFNTEYVTMNALAAVIASYGLLQDSTAVVIGAMIVATLLGPIMGIALALVDADYWLLGRALLAEIGGVVLVLAIALGIGKMHMEIPMTRAIISRTAPNILDLIIALAGGAAGAYAAISPRVSASIVGVAVATALLPPLCVCGLTAARGETQLAFGGFLLFLTNLVAIQLASSVVFWLFGYHDVTRISDGSKRMLLLHGPSLLLLLGLSVVLGINFRQTLGQQLFEKQTRNRIVRRLSIRPGSYLADLRFDTKNGKTVITAVIRTPWSIEPQLVKSMEAVLPAHKPPVELHVRSILTKEATTSGWLHQPPTPQSRAEPTNGESQ